MAQIAWTAEAQLWLRDIHDYVAAENPAAAQRVALAIYESVQVLHEHPRLGQRYVHVTDREAQDQQVERDRGVEPAAGLDPRPHSFPRFHHFFGLSSSPPELRVRQTSWT